MPNLVTISGVTVQREVNGQRVNVRPPLGEPYEYTKTEAEELMAMTPAPVRKPINEDPTPKAAGEKVADKGAAKKSDENL